MKNCKSKLQKMCGGLPVILPSHKGMTILKLIRCVLLSTYGKVSMTHKPTKKEKWKSWILLHQEEVIPLSRKIRTRLNQQKTALSKFDKKIQQQQEIGHAIQNEWSHVEGLIEQINSAVEKNGWDYVKQSIKEIPWISSVNAKERKQGILA